MIGSNLCVLFMIMISVNSSDLKAVGYENGILEISFVKGGLYRYSGVPLSVYQGLMDAGSHGKYFARYIKNSYSYQRIG